MANLREELLSLLSDLSFRHSEGLGIDAEKIIPIAIGLEDSLSEVRIDNAVYEAESEAFKKELNKRVSAMAEKAEDRREKWRQESEMREQIQAIREASEDAAAAASVAATAASVTAAKSVTDWFKGK